MNFSEIDCEVVSFMFIYLYHVAAVDICRSLHCMRMLRPLRNMMDARGYGNRQLIKAEAPKQETTKTNSARLYAGNSEYQHSYVFYRFI